MVLLPIPHTGVLPYPCAASDIARLGTFINWTTNDPALLARLHQAIVNLVQQVGVSGLVEIRNTARMAEHAWKTLGGSSSGLQNVAEMAAQDRARFPIPAEVLKYIKGFK
jgi:hypothetical protein